MDRFLEMQTFVRVVEGGSITIAAGRLNLAKSVVSRRLAELETRLGVQMFQRTTRKLNLTESGRGFYERALRVLADLEEAECFTRQEHSALKGKIRAALPLSFGLLHLAPAIDDFMHAHPDIEFDLDFNDRQVDLLQEGFDVAVRIARLGDSSLIARPLAPITHGVYASPAYLKRHGTPRHPSELANHVGLGYSNIAEPGTWTYHDQDGSLQRVRIPLSLRANNGDFLSRVASAGRGVLAGPTFYVYDAIRRGDLVRILSQFKWPTLTAYAMYPHTRHLSTRVRTFVDFLIERFAGVPYWDQEPGVAVKRARRSPVRPS